MGELTTSTTPGVVVVDGGGTKTDLAVLTPDGEVLAHRRHGAFHPQDIGPRAAVDALDEAASSLLAELGSPEVTLAAVYLSGLDFTFEIDALRTELARVGWAQQRLLVDNDLFPVLRAGTDSQDAVAVICGTGTNAIGRAATGDVVRFAAIGEISGDWGGGHSLGLGAVWHAARAEDGRGPQTALREAVLAHLGFGSMAGLIEAFHRGLLPWPALPTLAPTVLQVAGTGDAVARDLVHRQADEIVTFAVTAMRRLDLLGTPCPVVLAGGVVAARDPMLTQAIEERLAEQAPKAEPTVVTAPPLMGAALLALDEIGASEAAHDRARTALNAPASFPHARPVPGA